MRLALLVLVGSCGGLLDAPATAPPDIEVARASLGDRVLHFQKRYHWSPGRDEDGGHYEIDLANGTCWRLDDAPTYAEPVVTRALDQPLAITRKTTLAIEDLAGVRYLVRRGDGAARHILIPKARVEWIVGTLLVRVDDHIVHVGSGKAIPGAGSRTSRPFVVAGNRIVTRSANELVIYDRELAELVRWRPDPTMRMPDLIAGDHRGVVFGNDRELWLMSPAGKWRQFSYSNCKWKYRVRRPGD